MGQIIGTCGYGSTGSSAICDLLKEFEDVQVIGDFEFSLIYYPDGLQDLDWHINKKCAKVYSSLSIDRFRRLTSSRGFFRSINKSKLNNLTDEFLDKIIQIKYHGLGGEDRDKLEWFFRRGASIAMSKLIKKLKIKKVPELFFYLICHKREISVCPENFIQAAKEYVSAILDVVGYNEQKKVTLLNQPFAGNNPLLGFKYFNEPKAIIVDRDARDCYLFGKMFLRNRGIYIPVDTVENFIKWYKAMRTCPDKTIYERNDILFMNFEELVYDYENAVKKVADFCELDKWVNKGEFFKPNWSRNNTKLFLKYKGFEEDIAKIEKELPEYIFPFENYQDIEAVGEMFFGSQSRRG